VNNGFALSVLDLVATHAGDSPGSAIARSVDLARHVEALGYKRFWLGEHHSIEGLACSATPVLIGHVAGATRAIRVGSGGVMLPNHAPLVVAEQFGTLDAIYPGRIDLGIGRAPGGGSAAAGALRRGLNHTVKNFPGLLEELRTYIGPTISEQAVRAIPGEGSNVPIILLGSSGFTAQFAAMEGLPFAFAAHIAPENLLWSTRIYRNEFRANDALHRPHLMVAVHVIAADTNDAAQRLFTTEQQRLLSAMRNQAVTLLPPVDSMESLWSETERAVIMSKLAAALVGSRETIKAGLEKLVRETEADEIIAVTDVYRHEDRLRSYELVAEVAKDIASQGKQKEFRAE
jgi:luciferase family oxidoreductase group 1